MLRFAPSPTGDMHIGNLRAAIFNYIIAKQTNKPFLIRIEDTDTQRNIKDKDREILNLLNLFCLLWDKLIYQSSNFATHRKIAQSMINNNKAFYCYCSKEFLEQKREEAKIAKFAFRYKEEWAELEKDTNSKPVIRIRAPKKDINFIDEIKGELHFASNEMDSFVLIKDDGIPTYNFACAIDDMLYDIDFIVRGEDHTSNTPKQILIHQYIGYKKRIGYAHLPIILSDDGAKMSKRDKASSVAWLLEQGFLPQAIINYLISLGNHTPCEIFTLKDAIKFFDIKKIAKSPVKFDIKRLRFINREHLKRLSEKDFALLLESNDPTIGALAKLHLEESSTLNEVRAHITRLFAKRDFDIEYEGQTYKDECKKLVDILQRLITLDSIMLQEYENLKNTLIQESGLKGKSFFKPLRIILTNRASGIELNLIYPYLRYFLKDILSVCKD